MSLDIFRLLRLLAWELKEETNKQLETKCQWCNFWFVHVIKNQTTLIKPTKTLLLTFTMFFVLHLFSFINFHNLQASYFTSFFSSLYLYFTFYILYFSLLTHFPLLPTFLFPGSFNNCFLNNFLFTLFFIHNENTNENFSLPKK